MPNEKPNLVSFIILYTAIFHDNLHHKIMEYSVILHTYLLNYLLFWLGWVINFLGVLSRFTGSVKDLEVLQVKLSSRALCSRYMKTKGFTEMFRNLVHFPTTNRLFDIRFYFESRERHTRRVSLRLCDTMSNAPPASCPLFFQVLIYFSLFL